MPTTALIAQLREKVASVDPGVAKRLLTSPATSAVALLVACQVLLGDYFAWEPESIWVELEHRGVEVPLGNRAKIQAGLTLYLVPSFYWDGIVFEKTALALDGSAPNPDMLEEATAAQLAWAVREAAWIRDWFQGGVPDFDHEPKAYAAVVLFREGLVVAPSQLAFAQGNLNRANLGSMDLVNATQAAWAKVAKDKLDTVAFPETPEGVQCARLAAVALHVQGREKQTSADLAALS